MTNRCDGSENLYPTRSWKRRGFLQFGTGLLATGGFPGVAALSDAAADTGQVYTVLGPIAPEKLGETLPHEHVLVDFIGAQQVSRDRYDREKVFAIVLPYLHQVRESGCKTLVECTPDYLGRDALLLKRLSEASGLQILTNTGYYGAANDKFVPPQAYSETAEQLADRWLKEWKEGIEDTGIRPGFIKIGVDNGPLSAIDKKLVRAAAMAHRSSGLTLAVHTGDSKAAFEELAILKAEGVLPSAWIWVHAQSESRSTIHAQVAEQGGWLEFDGIGSQSIAQHVNLVQAMKTRGWLNRVLISQDAGWYHVGEAGGGTFNPYHLLFTQFLPALKKAGFTEEEIHLLLVENPKQAFTVRVRTDSGIRL